MQSLRKAIKVLRAFAAQQQAWGVRELARELSMPKSSVHKILQTFEEEGVLEKDLRTNEYSIGVLLFRLSHLAGAKISLSSIVSPFMRGMSQQCNETVFLTICRNNKAIFVDKAEAPHYIKYEPEMGKPYPLNCGSSGRALMAFLPKADIEEIINVGLGATGPNSITDPARLRRSLKSVRKSGFAFSKEERFEGIIGFAFPILDHEGNAIAGLNIAIPKMRFDLGKARSFIRIGKETVRSISLRLGYSGTEKT